MHMTFRLVLQMPKEDLETLTGIEERLEQQLMNDSGEIDGHDIGNGKGNIFIFTSDPKRTFTKLKPALEEMGLLKLLTIAYSESGEDDFQVIWPKDSSELFSLS
jgi:hypothetical protein